MSSFNVWFGYLLIGTEHKLTNTDIDAIGVALRMLTSTLKVSFAGGAARQALCSVVLILYFSCFSVV